MTAVTAVVNACLSCGNHTTKQQGLDSVFVRLTQHRLAWCNKTHFIRHLAIEVNGSTNVQQQQRNEAGLGLIGIKQGREG